MPFAKLVASGVALADKLTASLQSDVSYEAWIGINADGSYQYAAAVPVASIVERNQQTVVSYEGNEVLSTHTVNILRPIGPNGAAGRNEPVDPRDRFTLADGTTSRTLAVGTLVNPDTDAGYYHIVNLGAK